MQRKYIFCGIVLYAASGLAAGCGSGESGEAVAHSHQALTMPSTQLPEATVHTSLSFPKDAKLLELALASWGTLTIGGGARILTDSAYGSVSNMGSTGTTLAPDAKVSGIASVAKVTLGDRVQVWGDIVAPLVKPGANVQFKGTTSNDLTRIQPAQVVKLDVTYPAASAPTVWLDPNQTQAVAPGRYATLRAANSATIKLKAGTYFAEELLFESGSRLEIDSSAGTVVLFARKKVGWQGSVVVPPGQSPDWLLIYNGTDPLSIMAPFRGAIFAPTAQLAFQGTPGEHRGAFVARDINVDANQKIVHVPTKTILMALDPDSCSAQVPPRTDLSGAARENALQLDIARYCTARGQDVCQLKLDVQARADRLEAASSVVLGTVQPNVYLGTARDRQRKLARAATDAAYAQSVCTGPDADRDLIPDSSDDCSGTPPLTPTDDRGCPVALPGGPSTSELAPFLDTSWIALNKDCWTGTIPTLVTPGAFFWPSDASKGVFWVTSRARNQNVGCSLWYEIQIRGETRDGAPAQLSVVFPQTAAQSDSLVGMSGRPVPAEFVQFQVLPSDTGARGRLANDLKPYRGKFRARAINSAGVRSPWTDWRSQTPRDCQSLGFTCGG
jgi:hypothetical protein